MKDPKDIFERFKDKEHKLNLPPSPRAWERLEARLDKRQHLLANPGWAPKLLRNWLSMAAVLLLLVACISSLSILFQSQSEKTAMAETGANASFAVEEIGTYSDQNTIAYNISTYQKQLKRLNTNPILEGDPSKELRVRQAVFIALENRNRELDTHHYSRRTEKQLALQTEQTTAPGNGNYAAAATAPPPSTSTEDTDIVLTESNLKQPTPGAIVYEDGIQFTAQDATAEEPAAGLNQFEWLLGRWEVPMNYHAENGGITTETAAAKSKKESRAAAKASATSDSKTAAIHSFEEWTKLNGQTLSGSGYILKNGQPVFVDNMRIEQNGADLFYVLSLPNQKEERRYALSAYSAQEMVFENKALSFPNQVLLRPDASGQQLTIVLQNSNPVNIDAKMRAYFEQRNEISSEQIKRVMWKVE